MLSKIIGGSVAVAVALAFSASTIQAQQNILVNGDFEYAGLNSNPSGIDYGTPGLGNPTSGSFTLNAITATSGPGGTMSGINQGWATFGAVSQSDMGTSPDSPYSGTYALLEQNAPGNAWAPAGAYQIVQPNGGILAGATYTLSVWAITDTGTAWGPTPLDLQLSFNSSADGLSGTVTPTALSPNNGSFSYGTSVANAANGWAEYSVSAIAPAGATSAMVYLMFMDNGANALTDNEYFDNAVLSVPEPSSLALLAMGLGLPFYFIRRRKS